MMPRFAALLLVLVTLAGCASQTPTLYTLAPVAGPVRSGGPARIEIREIGLARYLDRPEIVRSTSDSLVALDGNERWGDPLVSMFGRVLAENLGQRLPNALVFGENGAISVTPDAVVEIDLQRMDVDARGAVELVAQVAVQRGGRTATRSVRVSAMPASSGMHDIVKAMSKASGELADAVAAMLA